jgi:NhaA family Na+:H+ antiporter
MSLFLGSSAFESAGLLSTAKIGILTASLLAGIMGFVLVILTSPTQEGVSSLETAPSPA